MKKNHSTRFQTIGVIGKHKDTEAIETLKSLRDAMIHHQRNIVLEKNTSDLLPGHKFPVKPIEQLSEATDLIIVIGGDGNFLHAARTLSLYSTPVLGINRGHLGFLTDIHPQTLNAELEAVLNGGYTEEERFLLHMQVERDGKIVAKGNALNEILLTHGGLGKMIEFEVYVDDQFVKHQRADGLIVATPTGSTAYALSANGPILHPSLDAIVLVPMCPHTLSSRPIVVEGNRQITLVISKHNKIHPKVSCDSQIDYATEPGDTVQIVKQKQLLRLIHPKQYCYFETLRSKLQWGQKL